MPKKTIDKEIVTKFLNHLGKMITIKKGKDGMFFVYEDDRQIGRGKYRELDPTDIVVGYIGNVPIYQKMMDQIAKRIKGVEVSFDELVGKAGISPENFVSIEGKCKN